MIFMEDKIKVVYLKVMRANYGCLESATLWYNLYMKIMKGAGFKLNSYDLFVGNKIINSKQCMIVFYINDNKINHVGSAVFDDMIEEILKY